MFKYSELMQALKAEIESLPPGARLATRQALQEKYRCARTTVDRAVAELAREGYVVSRQGSGTYAAGRGGSGAGGIGNGDRGNGGDRDGRSGSNGGNGDGSGAGGYAAREGNGYGNGYAAREGNRHDSGHGNGYAVSEGGSRYAVSEGNGAGNRADSLGSRAGGGNGNGAGEHGQDLSWALITPDVMNSIYTAILRGMCDIGHRHGIGVQIFNTDNDVPRQHGIIRRLVEGRCDGVVLVPAIDRGGQEDACRLLIESRVPLVFCNRRVEGIREAPLVCSNGYYGGYLATRHLLEMGYRKPAFFDMKTYSVSLERYYGYVAAVMEAGLPLDSRRVVLNGDFGAERHGYGEVAAMLRLADPPDSVFCAGEMFDMPLLDGVYRAVADAGLKISGDVGVISHDNSALCLRQIPNTTAVSYPAYESGLRAAEMLYGLMGGAPPPDGGLCILHPELVVRESCLGPQ